MIDVCLIFGFSVLLFIGEIIAYIVPPWRFYPTAIKVVAVAGILLTVLIGIVTRIAT